MHTIKCPVCGTVYHSQIIQAGRMATYRQLADGARSPFAESAPAAMSELVTEYGYRSMPVRSQNANDWLNPIALALGSGLFIGLPSGWVISSLFPRLSLGAGLACGFIVISGAVWLWRLGVYDTLLVMRENREKEAPPEKEDKKEDKPDPPIVKVEIESKDGEGYRAFRFADLPASRRKGFAGLNRFAGAVTSQGESFAERPAADFGGYSRQEWQTLRGIFLDRGWAAWNDPQAKNQGVTLTAAGRAIVRKIATAPLPGEHGREI